MGTPPPAGTVTFLFTDLADSTRLWEEHPDDMAVAVARHDEVVRSAVAGAGGVVVKSTGDGLMAAFGDAGAAVAAAVDAQRALGAESWGLPIVARMGLHTGAADPVDGDYHAPAVNRAARVAGIAHPGQVLVSGATAALVDRRPLRDLGEHRLRGLPAMRLLQVLADGIGDVFPPLATAGSAGGHLPGPSTSFVGRDDEVSEVAGLVADQWLVTLTGVGGCGKTRLALEVAERSAAGFVDGVRFVDLAPVTDEVGFLGAVGAGLGITGGSPGEPLDRLAAYVGDRTLLVVLDNCEHLLDGCAELAEAIGARPGPSRLLATSREPLGVAGERVHAVRSLDPASEAVELFADRAAAARVGFAVDAANREAITEICRRLDGIPLAIELAAARVAHLSPRQIVERLDDRFRLLVGGRRRVHRQQTLAATLDWSHELLTAAEQRVLRRLAVFPASFSLEAAEAVVGSEALGELGSLVAKSLVDAVEDGERYRYRLLETVRMYAAERLVAADEGAAARTRHLDWVTGWLEAMPLVQRWLGDDHVPSSELANIRAAVEWAAAEGDPVAVARIAASVDWTREPEAWAEGTRWCEQAIRSGDLPAPYPLRLATLVAILKTFAFQRDGLDWVERAIAGAGGAPGPELGVALSWRAAVLSVRAAATGDLDLAARAKASGEAGVAWSQQFPAPWEVYCRFVVGMALLTLAVVGLESDERAEEEFTRGLAVPVTEPGFAALRATLFEYHSLFRLLDGDEADAVEIARHAPSGDGRWPLFGPNQSVARILATAATGSPDVAREALRHCHDVFRRADVTRGPETTCIYGGALAAIAGDWDTAGVLLAAGREGLYRGAEAGLVYYRFRDRVRAAVGSERARALRARGMALPLDEAVSLALG